MCKYYPFMYYTGRAQLTNVLYSEYLFLTSFDRIRQMSVHVELQFRKDLKRLREIKKHDILVFWFVFLLLIGKRPNFLKRKTSSTRSVISTF